MVNQFEISAFCLQVIVTVPLFVLKSDWLRFTPDLPTRKQTAIKNLGAGLIEKVNIWHQQPEPTFVISTLQL